MPVRASARTYLPTLVAAALTAVPLRAAAFDLAIETSDAGRQIGGELATIVAPAAGVRLEVLGADGPADSLRRLRIGGEVKLAAVASDLDQSLLVSARRNDDGPGPPLRVIAPLYAEEIHLIARADDSLAYVHDIRDARINVGPPRSGTAEAVGSAYRRMFDRALPPRQTSHLPHEEALVKLVTDRTVDVVAIVAAQPVKVLAEMKPEARRYVKLLALDSRHAAGKAALREYRAATVRAASYPALLSTDVPALAAQIYLVTLDFRDHATESGLIRLARSLCANLARLRASGHPKWHEVALELTPLADGLEYYQPTTSELRACRPPAPRAR